MKKSNYFIIGLFIVGLAIGFFVRQPKTIITNDDSKHILDSLKRSSENASKILANGIRQRDSLQLIIDRATKSYSISRKRDSLEILRWKAKSYSGISSSELQNIAIKSYEEFHRSHPSDTTFN